MMERLREVVLLEGGPMAGMLVTPTAPALEPDWWEKMPRVIKARRAPLPGRYVRRGTNPQGIELAAWEEEEEI